ncbi:hypothetical protein SSBR45G_53710 [Bradyrhizobium sp. SSBR45G]|uniref:hypothetical protein n=1 Tax=unclassified Bradyrhizobium TaxID=2631580 RepID=UPI0023429815|nr:MULTISPECIES: hypothetical protein [unclassified Bradyrhizobium]GLH80462.1 hypothetical protein SSBR45G_53710 [Bradyrhizobium sp. SSBR45G]GLH87857.1 hypothetical protein SSBR45R_53170 [Bradyrhizobium sp. SSBR45R]
MHKSVVGMKLVRWGGIGLLGVVVLVIVELVRSGPLGYRPYYFLAVLLREPLDIGSIQPSGFYNGTFRARGKSLLICRANVCKSAEKIDVEPPTFEGSAEVLMERLDAVIMAEPGAGAAYLAPGDELRRRYILRAPPRGLPETIDLLVIPLDDTHATFALYARDLIRELAPDRSERTARWLKALRDAQ